MTLLCQFYADFFVLGSLEVTKRHSFFSPIYYIVFISGFSPRPEATCHSATCLCACVSVCFGDTIGLCILEAARLHSDFSVCLSVTHTLITLVSVCMRVGLFVHTFLRLLLYLVSGNHDRPDELKQFKAQRTVWPHLIKNTLRQEYECWTLAGKFYKVK